MSGSGESTANPSVRWVTRLGQVAMLVLIFGAYFIVTHVKQSSDTSSAIVAATGFLLVAGMLTSDVLEVFKLPHLTGYIAAGVLAGPHVLHFIEHTTVKRLELVNTMALALIALAGGLELRIRDVQAVAKSVALTSVTQTLIVFVSQVALFAGLASYIPFTRDLPLPAVIGVGVLWATLAVSRSPSALLAILSQTRAKGPLTRFSVAFVMSSDVLVLILMAAALTLVRPLVQADQVVSFESLRAVGHELLGSVALGTTLGLLLIAYLKLVGHQVLVLLVAFGFGLSSGLQYLHFEPMLTFLTAGFVVQNLSAQGDALLHTIEETGSVVFVVFFATAGAHLDIPLLTTMWPIALALCGARFIATLIAHFAGAAWASETPLIKRWGWAALVSQAGLTLGLAGVLARTFPDIGEGLRSLVVATVAINEVIGPIFFKLALERAGEVRSG